MDRLRWWAPTIGGCAFTVIFVEMLTMKRWAESLILLPVIVGLLSWDVITVYYYRAGWVDAADLYDHLVDGLLDDHARAELYCAMAQESETPEETRNRRLLENPTPETLADFYRRSRRPGEWAIDD